MKRLKIILRSKWFYIGLLIVTLAYSVIYFSIPHSSKLDIEDHSYIGTILNIEVDGDLLKLELQGKEKIIGNYFFTSEEEKVNFQDNYRLGDRVYLTGSFSLPKNNTVPNLFNYKEYLKRKEIYYVMQIDKIERMKENSQLFYKIKNVIIEHIENYRSKSYLKTFILGDNSLLTNKTIETYQENGISHLFAISGMHISLLSGIILLLLKKLRISNQVSYFIVITFLIFYMVLSGCSPSICRAVILFMLLGINHIFNLKIPTIFLFILTFCILVVINPYVLFEVGFEYSFIISFYLILLQKKLNDDSYIKGLLKISLISFLVSFPISIYYFYQVNLLSVLLNLIFVPLVSFIVFPLALLTFIFPFLDSIFLLVTNMMEHLSFLFQEISILETIWMKPSIWWIVFYYLFLTVFLYSEKRIGIFCILCLLCYQYFQLVLFPRSFFMMIDVGQGDSLLIHSNNQTVLIDTGGKINYQKEKWQEREIKSLTESTLLPLLKSLGIRKLDYLVLSHGDYDHMGEAIHLVEDFKVNKVIFNNGEYNKLELEFIEMLEKKGIPYYKNVEELNVGNNKLYFLNTGLYDNENDNSNVIYTKMNNYKFLFMGDAGTDKERDILDKYNIKNIDFLKVGHHGSNTSSSKYFMENINPKYSLISVGKNNRYGHPKEEVLNILEDSKIYRTDIDGSIQIKFKKDKYKIETCIP